ncbi:MAG TPA: ribosome maturation factor RimM [Candidatus Limnocylindria bacterium]
MTGPRSTSRSISEPDGLVVGVIKTPHGVRGEVRVDPRSDVPDRFRVGASLQCDGLGALTIRSIRGTPQEPIVGFEGYASRPDAEPLRGRFLRVAVEEARQATKGRYLWADLVGLRAETPAGEPIGDVREIIRAGETDVLVVSRAHGGELLVPAIASVVREVDVAGGRVVVVPQEELR